MKITEYYVELNENGTQNLVDENGNILLDSATCDELDDFIVLLQKEYVEHLDSLRPSSTDREFAK